MAMARNIPSANGCLDVVSSLVPAYMAKREVVSTQQRMFFAALRHGRASTDAAEGTRTWLEIMQRGGWRRDWSVRRYEKHGRLANVFWRTPWSVWQDAERAEQQIQELWLAASTRPSARRA